MVTLFALHGNANCQVFAQLSFRFHFCCSFSSFLSFICTLLFCLIGSYPSLVFISPRFRTPNPPPKKNKSFLLFLSHCLVITCFSVSYSSWLIFSILFSSDFVWICLDKDTTWTWPTRQKSERQQLFFQKKKKKNVNYWRFWNSKTDQQTDWQENWGGGGNKMTDLASIDVGAKFNWETNLIEIIGGWCDKHQKEMNLDRHGESEWEREGMNQQLEREKRRRNDWRGIRFWDRQAGTLQKLLILIFSCFRFPDRPSSTVFFWIHEKKKKKKGNQIMWVANIYQQILTRFLFGNENAWVSIKTKNNKPGKNTNVQKMNTTIFSISFRLFIL